MEGSCLAPGSTPRCGEEHGERSERLSHHPETFCEAGTLVVGSCDSRGRSPGRYPLIKVFMALLLNHTHTHTPELAPPTGRRTHLYGAVGSSEQSFVGGRRHRKGPLHQPLGDASLAPGDHRPAVTLTEYGRTFFNVCVCTWASERCRAWGCTSRRHWMLSQQIVRVQKKLETKTKTGSVTFRPRGTRGSRRSAEAAKRPEASAASCFSQSADA